MSSSAEKRQFNHRPGREIWLPNRYEVADAGFEQHTLCSNGFDGSSRLCSSCMFLLVKTPIEMAGANYTSVLDGQLERQRAPNSCALRSGVGVGPFFHLRSPIVFAMPHCSPWCHLLGNMVFAALHILSVAAQKVAIKCILHPGLRPPPPPPSPSTSL